MRIELNFCTPSSDSRFSTCNSHNTNASLGSPPSLSQLRVARRGEETGKDPSGHRGGRSVGLISASSFSPNGLSRGRSPFGAAKRKVKKEMRTVPLESGVIFDRKIRECLGFLKLWGLHWDEYRISHRWNDRPDPCSYRSCEMYQQPYFPVPFPLGTCLSVDWNLLFRCGILYVVALLPFTSSFSKEQELQDTLTPYVPILLDSVQLTNFSHIGPAARWIGETCAMRNDINTCDT